MSTDQGLCFADACLAHFVGGQAPCCKTRGELAAFLCFMPVPGGESVNDFLDRAFDDKLDQLLLVSPDARASLTRHMPLRYKDLLEQFLTIHQYPSYRQATERA